MVKVNAHKVLFDNKPLNHIYTAVNFDERQGSKSLFALIMTNQRYIYIFSVNVALFISNSIAQKGSFIGRR